MNACAFCGAAIDAWGGQPSTRTRKVAGLLAMVLGTLGLHWYYLGFNGKALPHLIVFMVSTIVYFIPVFRIAAIAVSLGNWIWAIVEGIVILTGGVDRDAEGKKLTA